jgi:dienelactone hydrolase
MTPEHLALIESVPLRDGASIESADVDYGEFEGYYAYDSSIEGPLPTVVIIHDWTGLREYPKARAQMLARMGYAAVCVDVYGRGIRFTSHEDAAAEAGKYYSDLPLLRSRVAAGFSFAASLPFVDESRMVVIGYCFGGSAALEFARTTSNARGFVSFHGGLITHEPADVSLISAPLLILTGGSDDVVPDAAIQAFTDELRTRDDIDWQVTVYAGAPHAFTLPGIPAYRAAADRRSWAALQTFLGEVL